MKSLQKLAENQFMRFAMTGGIAALVNLVSRYLLNFYMGFEIAVVLAYLVGCLLTPGTAGQTFDIGGPEVFTYEEMMQEYARARGLARRYIIKVPVLTPLLSAYWVDLVTPVASGVHRSVHE